MAVPKDDVIVKFFADDPDWEYRVFQMLTHFDVPQSLKDSQKSKLRTIHNPSDFIVVDDFFAVETVRRSLPCQDQIDELLSAVTVVANERILLHIYFFFNFIASFCQYDRVE